MRKILTIIIAASISISSACLLTACGNSNQSGTEEATSALISGLKEGIPSNSDSNSDENGEVNNTNAENIATEFVSAACKKDYGSMIKMFGLEESKNFLSKEDIEFFLPRSNYSDLVETGIEPDNISIISKTKETTKTSATIESQVSMASYPNMDEKDGNDGVAYKPIVVQTKVVLNDNNQWCVDGKEFYNKDFSIRVPMGVKVTVNGKEVSEDAIAKERTGTQSMSNDYVLGYVGKKDAKIVISCDNYTFEKSVPTKSGNEADTETTIYYVCDGKEKDKLSETMKKYWNEMYTMYAAGKTSSDAIKYLAKDADPDIVKTIWDGFKKITEPSATSSRGNEKFKITKVIPRDDIDSFYLTNDIVCFNFKYQMTWIYKLANWNKEQKSFSSIIFKKEGKEYKIYSISDEKLFTKFGSMNEW